MNIHSVVADGFHLSRVFQGNAKFDCFFELNEFQFVENTVILLSCNTVLRLRDFVCQGLSPVQFSQFAALTGYDAAIKETARFPEEHIEWEKINRERWINR